MLGWRDDVFGGYYGTAFDACFAQYQGLGEAPLNRFVDASDSSNWYGKWCRWTSFQWLCPQETGGGIGSCGTALGGGASFVCASGYTRVYPSRCVKDPEPETEACTYDYGGGLNPTAGKNPIVLRTGAKLAYAEDFATADGRFKISRTYRSFPIGQTTSAKQYPLGLIGGWQFSFAMELQLGQFSGSPSSPNAKVTLVTPDLAGHDFVLQSNGTWIPNPSSSYATTDYKLEYVGTLPANLVNVQTASTQWRVTDSQSRVWTLSTFSEINDNPASYSVARPITIQERDGYTWTLTYASDGRLSTIVDTFSRTATFTWHMFYITSLQNVAGAMPEPEVVQQIVFPDGTKVRYTFDPAPNLTAPSTVVAERLVGAERLTPEMSSWTTRHTTTRTLASQPT